MQCYNRGSLNYCPFTQKFRVSCSLDVDANLRIISALSFWTSLQFFKDWLLRFWAGVSKTLYFSISPGVNTIFFAITVQHQGMVVSDIGLSGWKSDEIRVRKRCLNVLDSKCSERRLQLLFCFVSSYMDFQNCAKKCCFFEFSGISRPSELRNCSKTTRSFQNSNKTEALLFQEKWSRHE